ncbi:MAG: hypothetical protein R6V55_17175 [Desulfovermiculus sp.]
MRETRLEQANLHRAAAMYAECIDIWILKLLPLRTHRLTAMEYIPGEKVTDVNDLDEQQSHRMAETMISTSWPGPCGGAMTMPFSTPIPMPETCSEQPMPARPSWTGVCQQPWTRMSAYI